MNTNLQTESVIPVRLLIECLFHGFISIKNSCIEWGFFLLQIFSIRTRWRKQNKEGNRSILIGQLKRFGVPDRVFF